MLTSNQNNTIQDILIQNISNKNKIATPLFTALTPFMKTTANGEKIIDNEALENYVLFLESPASKTMHFIDYLKERKQSSPSASVHKNFITHYGKLYTDMEQQESEPFLEEALKNI